MSKNYPANLLEALRLPDLLGVNMNYENLTADQMEGVNYVLSHLTERERIVLDHYYREGMTQAAIAEQYQGITENRVRGMINRALKKMHVKEWLLYAANGYEANRERLKRQFAAAEARYCAERGIANPAHIYYQGIKSLKLPPRMEKALTRSGFRTVRELLVFVCSPRSRYVRNFGTLSLDFARKILERENLLPENFKMSATPCIPQLDLEASVFQQINAFGLFKDARPA